MSVHNYHFLIAGFSFFVPLLHHKYHKPASPCMIGTKLPPSSWLQLLEHGIRWLPKAELWFLQESILYPCLGPDLGQYAKLLWEFGLNCHYHDWWLPAAENLLQCYGCWTFGQSQDKGQTVSAVLPWFEGDMKDSRIGARAACKGTQKYVQSKRHCFFKIPNIWWKQPKTRVLLKKGKHTYFCVTSMKYWITSTTIWGTFKTSMSSVPM